MASLLPEDQCLLMYSSGTTGLSKGGINHRMLLWAQHNTASSTYSSRDMVSLAILPLFHIGALQVCALPALLYAGTAVVARNFDPGITLDAINDPDLGVSYFVAVPAAFNSLRDHPSSRDTDFSPVKVAITGAEAAPGESGEIWCRGPTVTPGYWRRPDANEEAFVGRVLGRNRVRGGGAKTERRAYGRCDS